MRIIALILLLMTIWPARGQVTEWILPPQPGQITQNIHLVVDFSGSMSADQVSQAINQTLQIVSQSVDEVNIKVTVFGATHLTWPGLDNPRQPGWTPLPDANAIKELEQWLRNVSIDNNSTKLSEPLYAAVNEDIQKTVMVISDLFFDDPFCMLNMNYTKTTIGFIGIYCNNKHVVEFIQGLVTKVNGFMCVIKRDK